MKDSFQWLCDNVDLPDIDVHRLEQWITDVVAGHERLVGYLSYIFCDDSRILEVNRRYLGHDYYTDIITFDYSRGRLVSGDMFISLETVLTNSQLVGASFLDELHRVIIHGVLHLCGIDDKGPGMREIMEAEEDKALALLQTGA